MDAITSAFSFISTSVGLTSSLSNEKRGVFLKLDELNEKQRKSLDEMSMKFPDATKEDLMGYLKVRDFKVKEATAQYQTSIMWRELNMKVTIADVSRFILKPNGCEGVDGGMYVLEDMKGDCARDCHGRPVIYIQGMLHGTMDEMLKQMVYCMKRASVYYKEGCMKCSTVILDAVPKKGCQTTFRFPDNESKMLMNYQKLHFPGSLSSTTHICGIPSFIVWAFALCKPFMDEEAYNNMLVKPDYSHIVTQNYVTKENLPKECGGELEFDPRKYVEWRAREEGVEIDYNDIRRYDPKNAAQVSEMDMKASLMQTTALQLTKLKPTKQGMLSKQGSGKGFLANYKWKEKFVVVGPGGILYYFNSPELSDDNKVSTVITLVGSYIELLDKENQNGYSFQLVTAERNYIFCAKSEDERNEWIRAFNEQINIGDLTNDYQKKLHPNDESKDSEYIIE